MVEMRLRPSGSIVRVYSFNSDGTAFIFDPMAYMNNNQGMIKVKIGKLVPIDYPLHNSDACSKTKKNKAKARLHLVDAVWESTDGIKYSHDCIEEAIQHELDLMEKENNESEIIKNEETISCS